jgi:hypothetical protein
MKHDLQRSAHSNPLDTARSGIGGPSPSSAPLKGGVDHGSGPEATTKDVMSTTREAVGNKLETSTTDAPGQNQ